MTGLDRTLNVLFLIITCSCLLLSANAVAKVSNSCKDIHTAYETFDIEAAIDYDKSSSIDKKIACKHAIPNAQYNQNTDFFTCETLLRILYSSPQHLQKFRDQATTLTKANCIPYALNHPTVQPEYEAFNQLLNDLLALNLPNQQDLLDSLLVTYVAQEIQAVRPVFVQKLVELGAVGTARLISNALWQTYVGGGLARQFVQSLTLLAPKS